MDPLRVVIVDDEEPGRLRLRSLVARHPELQLAGEADSGRAAVDLLVSCRPDLVFLDIQMPDLDGFEVLRRLDEDALPLVVFVTAYDQFAVAAFEVHAVDYLLKPFVDQRFDETVTRAVSIVRQRQIKAWAQRLSGLLEDRSASDPTERPASTRDSRLAIPSQGRVTFVDLDEVRWVQSEGSYVRLHLTDHSVMLRESLTRVLARLGENRFARVHRSTLVRLSEIEEIRPRRHGDATVVLKDGTRLPVSRTYRQQLDRVTRR